MKLKKNTKISILILLLLMAVIAGYFGFQTIANWFNTYQIKFNQVLKVEVKAPFEVVKRKPQEIVFSYPDEIDTPIEKYICEKFGVYQCQTALAIAKAESDMKEDAINVNTNRTIDIGIFQVNSVHFKKEGCSPKELLDQYKNVDCSYTIWKSSGWFPWVSWVNNSYLVKIK